jgi:predicted AlkP superfamily pyrophosphatase or phosphodiesterase
MSFMAAFSRLLSAALFLATATLASAQTSAPKPRHNVIIFVADGLRRSSVTPEDMPTLYRIRTQGVDLRNSHSVFPTFTTANASVIATGHGLGDTGDFSNTLYPGAYISNRFAPSSSDSITPFLENDGVLASLNSLYGNNYLGEETLLTAAHAAGFNVASVGKLGPTAIQVIASVNRDELGLMQVPDTLILDDATGSPSGVPLPLDFAAQLDSSGLGAMAPSRSNGFSDASPWSNGFQGDAVTPGSRSANVSQEKWFTDVTTQFILPNFAAEKKPFVLLFWSRDPDGTQHNQGDSLQNLTPGINGPTVKLALKNADNCLKQLLDWLDKHPDIKASTDVLVTSDHGFATIGRRELNPQNDTVSEPSANLTYEPSGKDKPQPASTLPTGFLAIDLALYTHQRLFDPSLRSTAGDSVYEEVPLSGEKSHYPATGSALLGEKIERLDGSDARLIIASNGGSDLIYIPSKSATIVKETIATLADFDYIGGIFADDAYCPTATSCPGALPLSSIGLKGATALPTPAIVITYKVFYLKAGDLQSAVQISDTTLQEGQGMHGGFGRDQTWNNMAAIGPDFKKDFVDTEPVGNIDIVPTIAAVLGLQMQSHGKITGRILTEALTGDSKPGTHIAKVLVSAPSANGRRTLLDYQEDHGVHYYDRACLVTTETTCP